MNIVERLKWKLIYILIRKAPIIANCSLTAKGLKRNWYIIGTDPNDKFAIIKPQY